MPVIGRERTSKSRNAMKERMGNEAYREKMKNDKRAQRARKKEKEANEPKDKKVEKVEKKKNSETLQDIIDYILKVKNDRQDRGIKLTTLNGHVDTLKRLYKNVYGKNTYDQEDFLWLKDHKEIVNYINAKDWTKSTKNKHFIVLASISREFKPLEKAYKVYGKLNEKLQNELQLKRNQNKLDKEGEDKNLGVTIPYNELRKMGGRIVDANDRAIWSLYVLIPPRRAKDYRLMKLLHKNDYNKNLSKDYNYAIHGDTLSPTQFIFNVYKNDKFMGLQKIKIPKGIQFNLFNHIYNNKVKNGDFLFSKNGKEYSQPAYTTMIGDVFEKYTKKRTGVNKLRSSYITNQDNSKRKLNMNKWKILAYKMAHSFQTQQGYIKFDLE